MAQGLERRAQPQDNLRGQEAINPVTRQVPSVGAPQAPRVPVDSYTAQIAQQVNQFAQGRLAEIQQKRQERSMMDGQIAALQGQSFESVEMEGDKWALEGYRLVTAQTLSSSLLRAQEAEIEAGAYEQDPDTYRGTLVNRVDAMVSDIPDPRTRELAREQLMQQMPGLVDSHMKRNIAFKEQQNFDALAQSVDVLSRDNSSTGALIDFATGESGATAGLSVERRRAAVVQGVVNAFENNNPAAHAHLEAAGLLTTENLTVSQLQTIRQAQSRYEARFREVVNKDHLAATRELDERVESGNLDPLVAVEELVAINARHGLRTGAVEGGQIYDRARAGVEFAEGTRGLNVEAAGAAGDYELQARLLQDAVIHQESRGNPNAVSPVGATGIMQVMPGTAHNPGIEGIRNVFQLADQMGIKYSGKTVEDARELLLNEELNKAMGTEYLAGMLRMFDGNVELALAAYNAGPGAVKKHGGVPPFKETQDYVRKIMGSISDNRPDPAADRVAAEQKLGQVRERLRLDILEQISPELAKLDEMYERGDPGYTEEQWREDTRALFDKWGMAVDEARINKEQGMMQTVIGERVKELRAAADAEADKAKAKADAEQAVALETALSAADTRLKERRAAFEAGTGDLSLAEINQEYAESLKAAYEQTGVPLDAKRIAKATSDLEAESEELINRVRRAREEQAIRYHAEKAGTVGTLSADQQRVASDQAFARIEHDMRNAAAEEGWSQSTLGVAIRAKSVEWLAEQGVVDPRVQQQVNVAATGRAWLTPDGTVDPAVIAGVHMFASLYSKNQDLAMQYVPDPESRGRMLAVVGMLGASMPDFDAIINADLSKAGTKVPTAERDPIADMIYDTVQQVGLAANNKPLPHETAQRVDRAVKLARQGNITNTWFGGMLNGSAASALVPSSLLRAATTSRFDMADVNAARSLDDAAINTQYNREVTRFLEEVVPFMPATSQQVAVTMALDYVTNRGAVMGSSFVRPQPNEPGIRAQMFPGQRIENTAAVNTAIVEWMGSEEARAAVPQLADWYEANAPGAEFLRRLSPFSDANPGTRTAPDFTVSRLNGQYVAHIIGVGSIVLPLREIGDRYISTR